MGHTGRGPRGSSDDIQIPFEAPVHAVVMTDWLSTSEPPGDGDSIWIAVREWDGVHIHVDYAQTFFDGNELLIHRYEGEKDGYGEPWPPKDVIAWKQCDVPRFSS